jgi:DNA-binding NarL/FixJ family response regulator
MRGLLRREIEETGCCEVVGEAARAEVAAMAVETSRPDLVVMDWDMPGEDGVWATIQIKSQFRHVEVVAYTSADDPAIAAAFFEAGAIAHFDKSDLNEFLQWLVEHAGKGVPPGGSAGHPEARGGLPPLLGDQELQEGQGDGRNGRGGDGG